MRPLPEKEARLVLAKIKILALSMPSINSCGRKEREGSLRFFRSPLLPASWRKIVILISWSPWIPEGTDTVLTGVLILNLSRKWGLPG